MQFIPKVKLNNGQEMPVLGLGTWKGNFNSKTRETYQAVKDAIDAGYRHIDCAHLYQNENEIGDAIVEKISEGVVNREDLFIVSKLWNTFHRPDLVHQTLKKSLKDLKLTYLDLYLIHWPMAYKEECGFFPEDENGKILPSNVDFVDTWKEMEKLVDEGLVKSIGISNFNAEQVDRLCENARILPVTNQVESHPYLNQDKLAQHHMEKYKIILTAYSPLGSPDRVWAKPGEPSLLDDPIIKVIADKYGKSTAQILIKYQISKGFAVIPKSITKERIISNADVFDFELDKGDIGVINDFDRNYRFVKFPEASEHPMYPFKEL